MSEGRKTAPFGRVCRDCLWFTDASKQWECRRFPQAVRVYGWLWCGEWTENVKENA